MLIPIPNSAALLEAYRRPTPERHGHNKHCASQRSNPGGLDTRRRTTPFAFIPSPPSNSFVSSRSSWMEASLVSPEMQNGELIAAPSLLTPISQRAYEHRWR